jgi:small subunit ribosomal protein S5
MDYEKPQSEFAENVIAIDRVARVVAGGRRFRFRALVVVGNSKGRLGVGIAKGSDVQLAIAKAVNEAKKNLIDISITNGTIAHEITAKVSGASILLKPAAPGTGLIAGGTVRSVLEVSGVHNILSKSLGSSNKVNVAYATIKALQGVVPREEWITKTEKPSASSKKSAVKAEKAKATA